MTLKNEKLIALVKGLGEDVVLEKIEQKLRHDAKQKAFHKTYNAARNATFRSMREIAQAQGITVEELVRRTNARANGEQ